MKVKLITLFILLCTLVLLIFYLPKSFEKVETNQQIKEEDKLESLKTFTYVITEVKGNNYYGQSIDGKTKIHFNSQTVKYPIREKIKIQDKILAYVESENHVDGIVKIEKLDN